MRDTNHLIDLRSDTLTQACHKMREAIFSANIGDDGYEEDETTLELESYCADFFEKEAALFVTSGTMSNQIAIRYYTNPGDEIILDSSYHINYYEAGPTIDLGKVYLNTSNSKDGILTVSAIEEAISNKHRSELYNFPTLICVENTINAHGGKIFPIEELTKIYNFSRKHSIPIHMDGARLLNATVATGISPKKYAAYVDSLTVCFSKGLGAPYGSILMGTKSFIQKVKKYRKWYGGGLHQSGFMAAAALYAIKNNIPRLAIDNHIAKKFAELLSDIELLNVDPVLVETNIIMLDVSQLGITSFDFVKEAKKMNILLYPWSKYCVRAVTYSGITIEDIINATVRLKKVIFTFQTSEKFYVKEKENNALSW